MASSWTVTTAFAKSAMTCAIVSQNVSIIFSSSGRCFLQKKTMI